MLYPLLPLPLIILLSLFPEIPLYVQDTKETLAEILVTEELAVGENIVEDEEAISGPEVNIGVLFQQRQLFDCMEVVDI